MNAAVSGPGARSHHADPAARFHRRWPSCSRFRSARATPPHSLAADRQARAGGRSAAGSRACAGWRAASRVRWQPICEWQVHVVNIWASWCAPCRVEHEYLMELRELRPGAASFTASTTRTRPEAARASFASLAIRSTPSARTSAGARRGMGRHRRARDLRGRWRRHHHPQAHRPINADNLRGRTAAGDRRGGPIRAAARAGNKCSAPISRFG